MKTARYLSSSLVALLLATTGAVAAPSSSDPPEDPYSQLDPDGVPLAVTQPQKQPSQADIEAMHKQQEKAAADKNWLLRDYEQLLQARNKANGATDQTTNLYYQLSSNKALAKLAGLPTLDSNNEDGTTTFRTGTDQSGPSAVALRADASSSDAGNSALHGTAFKPLVAPLSAPEAAGMHNFYSSLPVAIAPHVPDVVPSAVPAPQASSLPDSGDIDTPGMVAAKNDPLSDMSSSDLTLDILPGETAEQAREHQESNGTKLELPLPMDANQLHKQQAAALSVAIPIAPIATGASAPVPPKAVPIVDPEAPMPVNSIAPINPVRAPIASPYDILNR